MGYKIVYCAKILDLIQTKINKRSETNTIKDCSEIQNYIF